jgi:hypothetical protein
MAYWSEPDRRLFSRMNKVLRALAEEHGVRFIEDDGLGVRYAAEFGSNNIEGCLVRDDGHYVVVVWSLDTVRNLEPEALERIVRATVSEPLQALVG